MTIIGSLCLINSHFSREHTQRQQLTKFRGFFYRIFMDLYTYQLFHPDLYTYQLFHRDVHLISVDILCCARTPPGIFVPKYGY